MPDTIPGGATLLADRKTWVNAEGKPLSDEQIAAVKQLLSDQAEANANAEAALQRQAALSRNMVVVQAAEVAGDEVIASAQRSHTAAMEALPNTQPEPEPEAPAGNVDAEEHQPTGRGRRR